MKSSDAFYSYISEWDMINNVSFSTRSSISARSIWTKNRFCTFCIVGSLTPAKISWNWAFLHFSLQKRPSFQTSCCKLSPYRFHPKNEQNLATILISLRNYYWVALSAGPRIPVRWRCSARFLSTYDTDVNFKFSMIRSSCFKYGKSRSQAWSNFA